MLEEIGYVVETVSIFGRTTAVVHALPNCYAPTIVQTYGTPPTKKRGCTFLTEAIPILVIST